jgi:hypothetical protein
MNIFVKLDDFLMDEVFQKFVWWFQKIFGKTNFWLARVSCTIFIISAILVAATTLIKQNSLLSAFFYVFWLLPLIFFYENYRKDFKRNEEQLFEEGIQKKVNERRIIWILPRILLIWITPFFVISNFIVYFKNGELLTLISEIIYNLSVLLVFYFASCTPLPPAKSKVKEWLESWQKKPQLVPVKENN